LHAFLVELVFGTSDASLAAGHVPIRGLNFAAAVTSLLMFGGMNFKLKMREESNRLIKGWEKHD